MATGFGIIGGLLNGTVVGNSMAYTAAHTWASWNQVYYTTGNTTTNVQTWGAWNDVYGQQTTAAYQPPSPQFTVEQLAEFAAQAKKLDDERLRAKLRAEELLLEHLDPHQRESYKKNHLFIVETPKKNRYKLALASQPRKLDGDKEVVSYCIHTHGVPREDELLGFKLLLEANEDLFLKTANATRLAA